MGLLNKIVDPFDILGTQDKVNVPKPVDIFAPGKMIKKGPQKGQYAPSVASQQLKGVTGYYGEALPSFLNLSGQYTPQFMEQAFGFGGQATTGFQALQDVAAGRAAQSMADLRAQELGQMTGQAGMTRGLMEALSPEQAAAVQASAQEAERARAASMGVTPQERRAYEQQAREGFQAAGRLGGNAAVSAEIMGREDVLARKRAEAAQARQQSYGLASGFYTQPGLQALQRTPAAYQAGAQMAGLGMEYGQTLGPQLDYNMPLNFAQQRAGALDAQSMEQFQADQQRKAQILGLIKNVGAIAAAPATGGASLAMMG